jgi:hypothetical protein
MTVLLGRYSLPVKKAAPNLHLIAGAIATHSQKNTEIP